MSRRHTWTALAALGLIACAQDDQAPFDLDPTVEVKKEIGANGGTISTPAGASLAIPAGALSQSAAVTIKPIASFTPSTPFHGTVVPGTAFALGPAGLTLSKPARLELQIGAVPSAAASVLPAPDGRSAARQGPLLATQPNPLDQLLGLTIVHESSGGIQGLTSVLISQLGSTNHSASVDLDVLDDISGNYQSYIAAYNALLAGLELDQTMSRGSSLFPAKTTTSYALSCGLMKTPCVATDGSTAAPIELYADQEILERYPAAGALISRASGELILDETKGTVMGSIEIVSSLRVRIGASITSKDASVSLTTGPEGTSSTAVGVPYTIEGNTITFDTREGRRTLRFTVVGDTLVLSTPEVTVELKDNDGVTRTHRATAVIRLQKRPA